MLTWTVVILLRYLLTGSKHHKGFFEFWWDEELSLLKEESVESNKMYLC